MYPEQMDPWYSVCGEPMHVWTNGFFGICFSTLVFSYAGHFLCTAVTAFYLGRFPKSTAVREPFRLPRRLSYSLQLILTLLICDPLLKLIVVIFVADHQNSFVEDFKLMLMFTTWALNLTYYRRLAISNYVKLPGIVPITFSCAVLFFAQIPVVLSGAIQKDFLDLAFLAAYQLLMLLAIIGYVAIFFNAKRRLFAIIAMGYSRQVNDDGPAATSSPLADEKLDEASSVNPVNV